MDNNKSENKPELKSYEDSKSDYDKSPNTYNKRRVGSEYEKIAVQFLEKNGYEIIISNFYCRQGEIDIVARDGKYLAFVEVKYRTTTKNGQPEEAVNIYKQRRIINAAKYFMYKNNYAQDTPCRFDVVAVMPDKVRLLRNAFNAF